MTFKSLVVGSTVLMMAASAHGADAIIAEPEPVEYVRVCDAYGAGFFYIPGTQTCLSISGYVWYQIGATSQDGPFDTPNFNGFSPDGWNKTTRARLNFDARSETEWGTLRGYIRFQANWGEPFDGPVRADQAFLELGGFRAGYTESAWSESMLSGVASGGSHSWNGMYYADQQRHQISYSLGSREGFAATLSLEDDALSGDGYIPDIVGVASFNQTWGGIWAKLAYDEDRADATTPVGQLGDHGWAAQAGLHWNIPNAAESSLRLLGFYSDSDNIYGPGIVSSAKWSVLASYYHQFTPRFGASVAGQYFSDFYLPGQDVTSGQDGWAAELSAVWTPIDNFEMRSEIQYDKHETLDGSWSGFLRFTRFF